MTNETTHPRSKILIVEDNWKDQNRYRDSLGDKVDCPIVGDLEPGFGGSTLYVNREASLKNLEKSLREIPYAAIFMDGDLGLRLDSSCDGAILVKRIRQGVYGHINQNTEIQNISSTYTMTETKKDCDKERLAKGGDRDPIQYAKRALGEIL